ncbi:MAG TPA: hypothetical protein DCE56_17005 [Cyanobacteria bacterium UBA8553]|nr:hypothetical protein [Cyanobacteria bacterium UBA8553]
MNENFTPAHQKLFQVLDKINSSPFSEELMTEGHEALDEAVAENQRLQDSIHQASTAMRNARQCNQGETAGQ